jgi:peptidyl-prolyl cis-trans isomerase NIMA-interacting 1
MVQLAPQYEAPRGRRYRMRRSFLVFAVVTQVGVLACDSPSSSTSPSQPAPNASASGAPPATSASSAASATSPAPAPSGAKPAVLDTIVAQHILIGYKGAKRLPKTVVRSRAEAIARADEALAKLRAGAEFEDMVKEYSDDPGSVDRLGLLGKFHRKDLDPAFSKAAFALQVEQISDVVETPFGFHIIKRTQ